LALGIGSLIAAAVVLTGCGSDTGSTVASMGRSAAPGGSSEEIARRIGDCLHGPGYRVLLMPVGKEGNHDGPHYAVAYQTGTDRNGGGEIAVYDTAKEASRKEPGVEANSGHFGGVVEQHGRVDVAFFSEPSADVHEKVIGCSS
jgi:hypothetical protein